MNTVPPPRINDKFRVDIKVPAALLSLFEEQITESTRTILIAEGDKFMPHLAKLIQAHSACRYLITVDNEASAYDLNKVFIDYSNVSIRQASIYQYGFITDKFDLILAVPEYGVISHAVCVGNLLCRELELKAAENLLHHITENGRLAIVLHIRLTYGENQIAQLRNIILDEYALKHYSELPPNIFSGTTLRTYLYEIENGKTGQVQIDRYIADIPEISDGGIARLVPSEHLTASAAELKEIGGFQIERVRALRMGTDWRKNPYFTKRATKTIPDSYLLESARQGTIVRIEYDTLDYARNREPVTKPAYVYLPYGYDQNDENTRYNVVYFMHGFTGTAEEFFTAHDGMLKKVLDHMIAGNEIKPVIAVSPTFDADNKPANYETSVLELTAFHNEFVNELVPAVEDRFHSYAESVSLEGMKASRGHRAFSGMSLGCAATWYAFIYNMDIVKYFLPLIGDCRALGTYGGLYYPEETTRYLIRAVEESGYTKDDFFIYYGTATGDSAFAQVFSQITSMQAHREMFTEKNLAFGIKAVGKHDLITCFELIYNSLTLFFDK